MQTLNSIQEAVLWYNSLTKRGLEELMYYYEKPVVTDLDKYEFYIFCSDPSNTISSDY